MKHRLLTFDDLPTISVLLVISDSDEVWIKAAVSSVLNGIYPHVEVCVCDDASQRPHVGETLEELAASDARVKVHRLPQPADGVGALNAALSLATGRFVTLLGEGDKLAPAALLRVVDLLQSIEADVIYADEDLMDVSDRRYDPVFKPYWSPDLLLSTMYLGRPCVIRRSIVKELGGFREDLGGAGEYDLMLRIAEKTSLVHHLPRVVYHRRVYEREPIPAEQDPQEVTRRAVQEALDRRAVEATVEPGPDPGTLRVIRRVTGQPSVSVVALRTGEVSVDPIQELERSTNYPLYEVLLAGVEKDVGTLAGSANLAAAKATGEYLLFLRDYEEAPLPGWVVELLRHARRIEAGAVGGRVMDGDGNARYAGSFFLELSRLAGTPAVAFPRDQQARYLPVTDRPFNPYAVSADCMMVRRSVFEDVGGFDDKLPMTFYDLDFSFRLREKGLMNVYTPEAVVVSKTHRPQPSAQEIQRMWERWWPMLVKALYYKDSPLLTAERIPERDLLSLVSASV